MKSHTSYLNGIYQRYYKDGSSTGPESRQLYFEEFIVSSQSTAIPKGDRLKPNPLAYSKLLKVGAKGTVRYPKTSSYGVAEGVILPSAGMPATFLSNPDGPTIAYNDAVAKLGDAVRGNLDLGIDAAQFSESQRMLRSAMHVVEYARDIRRSLGRNWVKAIGGKWLEYRYGWSPLVADMYEAYKRLHEHSIQPWTFKVRGRYRYELTGTVSSVGPRCRCTGGFNLYSCELGLNLLPRPNRLTAISGYTSLNPASITWELLPYSFVVDWFYDVGGYLRNLETALIYRDLFHSGYRTDLFISKYGAEMTGSDSDGTFYDARGASSKYVTVRRSILSSYPSPRPPVFSPNLGSGRLLNAAALLSQFLRGK